MCVRASDESPRPPPPFSMSLTIVVREFAEKAQRTRKFLEGSVVRLREKCRKFPSGKRNAPRGCSTNARWFPTCVALHIATTLQQTPPRLPPLPAQWWNVSPQETPYCYCEYVLETVIRFCQSHDAKISDQHVRIPRPMPSTLKDGRRQEIRRPAVQWVKDRAVEVWERMGLLENTGKSIDNVINPSHAQVLKAYQLSKPDLSRKYDLIMLDEAQDVNPCQADIVGSQDKCRVIVVGDAHQARACLLKRHLLWLGSCHCVKRLAWPCPPLRLHAVGPRKRVVAVFNKWSANHLALRLSCGCVRAVVTSRRPFTAGVAPGTTSRESRHPRRSISTR